MPCKTAHVSLQVLLPLVQAMDGAFASMSWDDAAVKARSCRPRNESSSTEQMLPQQNPVSSKAALPEYLKSSGEERAKAHSVLWTDILLHGYGKRDTRPSRHAEVGEPLLCMCKHAVLLQVDYAFNALIPRPPQSTDGRQAGNSDVEVAGTTYPAGKQAVMHTWIKARLFSYNKVPSALSFHPISLLNDDSAQAFPFNFSPYAA